MRFAERNVLKRTAVSATATRELALELVDASCRVDEALFPRVRRVRVRRDVARNHAVFDPVDDSLEESVDFVRNLRPVETSRKQTKLTEG